MAIAPKRSLDVRTDTLGNRETAVTENSTIKLGLSKEWVIPPRPKPGRKPSSPHVGTKRKEQNRVSQKAFRDRQSSRVAELQDEIRQLEDQARQREGTLRALVQKLQDENTFLSSQIAQFVSKQKSLNKYPSVEGRAMPFVSISQMPDVRHVGDQVPIMVRSRHTHGQVPGKSTPPKRDMGALSDLVSVAAKKSRLGELPGGKDTETLQPAEVLQDGCGFCSGNTPCVCKQRLDEPNDATDREASDIKVCLAPINDKQNTLDMQKLLPMEPPRFSLVHQEDNKPRRPGTCAQCQSDPERKLFCQSLASQVESNTNSSNESDFTTSLPSSKFLDCSQVYSKLRQHEGFSSADKTKLIRELATGSRGMEIEVHKVESALRSLDKGLGMGV